MDKTYQKTIKRKFVLEGIALHSGRFVKAIFKPSPPNTGIVFIRSDIGGIRFPASIHNVTETNRATSISDSTGFKLSMIEHSMSALRGLGIDNVQIEVNGDEMPVLMAILLNTPEV